MKTLSNRIRLMIFNLHVINFFKEPFFNENQIARRAQKKKNRKVEIKKSFILKRL